MFLHLQLGFKATGDPVGTATARFYVADHLGTVRVEMDGLGNVLTTNDYEPYGVALPPRVDTESRLKLTGQERDSYTNYDYMHFRFYASSMGRFLKPDNIIPDITNPQNWNAYTYVKGNPVNFNDPNGHTEDQPLQQEEKQNAQPGPTQPANQNQEAMKKQEQKMVTIVLNVVIDKNLSPEKQAEVKQKFIETQLSDAQKVYGKAGINLQAKFSVGDVSWKNLSPGKLSVLLSTDFADLAAKGTAGGTKVLENTAGIQLAMNRVSSVGLFTENTFTHELGHAFGAYMNIPYMAKDAFIEESLRILMNVVTDVYIKVKTMQIETLPAPLSYCAGTFYRSQAKKLGE